jgi:hypothetical protein
VAYYRDSFTFLPLRFILRYNTFEGTDGKSVTVTDRGGAHGYEKLKFLHFLENQISDDGKVLIYFISRL